MFHHLRPAIASLLALTLVTGVAYPLVVTALAQAAFPEQANGSLVRDARGTLRGSTLLAQPADGPQWFHPRPSAADYASVPSGASNLAADNPALVKRIAADARALAVPGQGPVPLALVTTSASGLDPHLPPAAARYQVARIAAARGLPVEALERLVAQHTRHPAVGPAVVNVLALNLALANRAGL